MNTITLYLDARSRTRRAKSLLVGGIVAVAVLAIADRPPSQAEPPEEKMRIVTTTVVQIERVPSSCEQYGPPAPTPLPLPPPTPTPAPSPTPPPTPTPTPRPRVRPRYAPAVSPLNLSFLSPGWEPVAIMNPYAVPIRIRNIVIPGNAKRDFEILGASQCIGTLRPGERCRFSVFGRPAAGSNAAIRIEIHHDASSKPLVIVAATGG